VRRRFKTLDDVDARGRTVLLRVDLNLPMTDGRVTDATRAVRLKPSFAALRAAGAKVAVLSHFGRPKGRVVPAMSLRPVRAVLAEILDCPVAFAEDCVGAAAADGIANLPAGGVALLENLRFHAGEEANDPDFAARLAALGDLYVNDAFSASHRAHASIVALARLLPAVAGRLMAAELDALTHCLEAPERPLAAIVGGAKIATKLDLLANLVAKVDLLAIGGGMANTFLYALGTPVGRSLCERDMAETARTVIARAARKGCEIVLPSDAVVAAAFAAGARHHVVAIDRVPEDLMILDIGPNSAAALGERLAGCRSLVWNGPLGAFEVPPFDAGTNTVARAAAALTRTGRLRSVAGGGDTVAALAQADVVDDFTYVSTAGGAFLEWLEGKTLPGVSALS